MINNTSPISAKVFFIGFLIFVSFFLVKGAVKTFLSPQKLESLLVEEIRKTDLNLSASLENVQPKWFRLFLPSVGFEVRGLRIKSLDKCQANYQIYLDKINIHLSLWALLRKSSNIISEVQSDNIQVKVFSTKSCSLKNTAELADRSNFLEKNRAMKNNRVSIGSAKSHKIHPNVSFKDSRNIYPRLRFTSKRIQLNIEDLSGKSFLINDLVVSSRTKHIKATANVNVGEDWFVLEDFAGLDVSLFLKDRLSLSALGRYREATMQVDISSDKKVNALTSDVKIRNAPQNLVFKVLNKLEIVKDKILLPGQWIDLEFSGGKKKGAYVFNISKFKTYGKFGDIDLEAFKVFSKSNKLEREDIQFRIADFETQKLLNSIGFDHFNGLFYSLGKVSGNGYIYKNNEAKFNGLNKNIQLRFSRKGLRLVENISSNEINIKLDSKKIEFELFNFIKSNGKIDASVAMNQDRITKKTKVNIMLNDILFSSSIQKAFFRGELQGFRGNIKMDLDKFQLAQTKFEFLAPRLAGSEFGFSNLHIRGSCQASNCRMQQSLHNLQVPSNHKVNNSINTLFLDEVKNQDGFKNFKKFSFSASFLEDLIYIDKFNLKAGFKQNVRGELKMQLWNKSLKGKLTTSLASYPHIEWDISGPRAEPIIAPNYNSIKEIVKQQGGQEAGDKNERLSRWLDQKLGIKKESMEADIRVLTEGLKK